MRNFCGKKDSFFFKPNFYSNHNTPHVPKISGWNILEPFILHHTQNGVVINFFENLNCLAFIPVVSYNNALSQKKLVIADNKGKSGVYR